MPGVFLTSDLLFSSKVTGAATARGLNLEIVSSSAELLAMVSAEAAEFVLLDLSTAGLEPGDLVDRLRRLARPPRAIVAFAPHVHKAKLDAAREAGCNLVLSRGQLSRQVDQLLADYLEA